MSRQEPDARVLALAGLVQALQQVRRIADTGQGDGAVLDAALDSVFRIDAESPTGVYGGVSALRPGLVLLQRLHEAGQCEHARVGFLAAHAACSRSAASRGASVDAMTAPPRQVSPSYSTRDCPGVTARWWRLKRTARLPSSSTSTSQSSAGWR